MAEPDPEAPLLSETKPDEGTPAWAEEGTSADGVKTEVTTTDAAKKAMGKLPSIHISHAQLPLAIVFVASLVLLFAVGAFYGWGPYSAYSGYALSVACVPLCLSFLALAMTACREETYVKYDLKYGKYPNLICFLYSFVGACFLTMKEPFTMTGNGYFAAWAMVYGSAMTIGLTISALGTGTKGFGPLMGAVVASLVLIISTINPIRDGGTAEGEAIYALALSCLTVVFVLGVSGANMKGAGRKVLKPAIYSGALAALTVWWMVMAFLVTFRGPFLVTGNGYFSSWGGTLLMALAAFIARQDV